MAVKRRLLIAQEINELLHLYLLRFQAFDLLINVSLEGGVLLLK